MKYTILQIAVIIFTALLIGSIVKAFEIGIVWIACKLIGITFNLKVTIGLLLILDLIASTFKATIRKE